MKCLSKCQIPYDIKGTNVEPCRHIDLSAHGAQFLDETIHNRRDNILLLEQGPLREGVGEILSHPSMGFGIAFADNGAEAVRERTTFVEDRFHKGLVPGSEVVDVSPGLRRVERKFIGRNAHDGSYKDVRVAQKLAGVREAAIGRNRPYFLCSSRTWCGCRPPRNRRQYGY